MRAVVHLSRVIETKVYTRYTTLCNRMRVGGDGMNVTEKRDEVTCKFCLKAMNRNQKETARG